MRKLSKSKIMALRQCPKRLWLEVHRPELRQDSDKTKAGFKFGHQVGEIAYRIYDPKGRGVLIDAQTEGFDKAFERTQDLLHSAQPIFEAGFSAAGALAFADVMLPDDLDGIRAWRMIEIKSSTSFKDYYRDDVAIQAYVARASGVLLKSVSLAHIDSSWVYQSNGYKGLLIEHDVTTEVLARTEEVKTWIAEAQSVATNPTEPKIQIGEHCENPNTCGFYAYCSRELPVAEYPIEWLPRLHHKKKVTLAHQGIVDMRDVPDDMLNESQQLVKKHTLNNVNYFDAIGASTSLTGLPLPAYFIDFETVMFAVPKWEYTRPYQQITFQFSVHKLTESSELEHTEFIDISGNDPSEAFANALLAACGEHGPVFVYNAGFESARINELAERYPRLNKQLLAINERIVDLLPIAREHYYHPSQHGSWSIKKVLTALVPELRYDALEGVQHGNMAVDAYMEAINQDTKAKRKDEIQQQLLAYCKLDTYAMVRLWDVFSGRKLLQS